MYTLCDALRYKLGHGERTLLEWHITFAAIVIGFVWLMISCVYMENPWGVDELYYGYPLLWLKTSKSLLISFPPIPLRADVLWQGLILDMLLYSSGGFVVSYLMFTLQENRRLLKFLIKSGFLFFVGSYLMGLIVYSGPSLSVVPPFVEAVYLALFFSVVAAPASTIIYGYYRLMKKRKSQKHGE